MLSFKSLRPKQLSALLMGGVLLTLSIDSCTQSEGNIQPMNFLVIMADDVASDYFGCYGDHEANTPNIDQMAENGIMFTTCWATPICSPSRALILTGRYAHQTGWYHNALRVPDEDGSIDFQKSHQTFAALLKAGGYATALGGKWQLPGKLDSPEGGFDEYCIWEPGKESLPEGSVFTGLAEDENTLARYWHPALVRNGELVRTHSDDFGPDIVVDFLIDFMQRNKEKPFLAYYSMILPHGTRNGRTTTPMSGISGDHLNGTFRENIDYTDVLVGRLIKSLEEMDLIENTLVIFTADNPLPEKNRATADGANVPMVIYSPRIINNNHVSDELVSFADIHPTLIELAGIKLPENYELDGISLAPYLRGETDTHREYLYSYVGTARMIRNKRWVLEAVDEHSGTPQGRLYDYNANHRREIKDENNDEARKTRQYFENILSRYPSPDLTDPVVIEMLEMYDNYKFRHKLE
jgi:arylsulfatase A